MTTVLVTGGAGYIGSHVCKELARAGYQPVAYDDLSTGHRWAVRYGPLVEGDIADVRRVLWALRTSGADAIIHLAARAEVGESMRDPRRYFRTNVGGTVALLDAAHAAGLRHLVFSSTCAIYGEPRQPLLTEDHPRQPASPYGASKLMVEDLLRWNEAAHGLKHVALRYFNAAGADPDGEVGEAHHPESHLIPRAIHAAMRVARPLEVFGTTYPTPDGTAIRDYVHVTDVARAHVAALRYLEQGGTSDAFNIGSGTGASVLQVIECIENAMQRRLPRIEVAPRRGDPAVLVADPTRAKTVLGWKAELSDLGTIVDTAWRWHRHGVLAHARRVSTHHIRARQHSTSTLVHHARGEMVLSNDAASQRVE